MPNVALQKPVEERIQDVQAATDGDVTHYTANRGFTSFDWPGTLTIDVASTYTIRCIRILLWDGLGEGNRTRDPRFYLYRLLVSVDHNQWKVLFDTGNNGYNGWQVFNFPDGLRTRYIRIHGLANSANRGFHVVQLEAYDEEPPALAADVTLQRIISTESLDEETGDALPIESKIRTIINDIENLVSSNPVLNAMLFRDLIDKLRLQLTDVSSIERSMDSIRREIIGPVKDDLRRSGKIGKLSFWIGLVGGILAIISLTLNIYTLI